MKQKRGLTASPKYSFGGGVVTTVAKTRLRPSQLIKGKNINLSINGEAETRGGFDEISTTAFGAIIDRFIHFKTDSYDKIIAYGDTHVKRLDPGGEADTWTPLSSTMPDTDDYRSMVIANNILYIAAHNGVKKYYPGQSVLWNAGITAPSVKLTTAEGDTGLLNGTYQWYYTYYNATTGEESDPNPIADERTVTLKKVVLSAFVASTDPQVTKQKIYRNSAGVSDAYYFVAEKDNDTNDYEDNIADDNLGIDMSERNGVPPNSTILLWHMNRMFYVDYSEPSKLVWSEPFLPGSVYYDSYQYIEKGDGGKIIALVPSYGNIIVFKNTGIYTFLLNTEEPKDSDYIPLAAEYGCIAPMSAKNIREDVVFLSAEGLKIISQSGTKIDDIKVMVEGEFGPVPVDPVANFLRECHQETVSQAVGIFYEAKNQYHLSIPYYSWANNDFTLVWNLDCGIFTYHEGFYTKTASLYRQYDNNLLYRSHNDQYIYRHDYGETDNGVAISYEIQTSWHQINDMPDYKRLRLFCPTFKGGTGTIFTYEILKDFEAAGSGHGDSIEHLGASYWGYAHWGQDYWGQSGEVPYRIRMKLMGRHFSVRFYGSTSLRLSIVGYQFFYQPKAL
jgi:hypothetical protein